MVGIVVGILYIDPVSNHVNARQWKPRVILVIAGLGAGGCVADNGRYHHCPLCTTVPAPAGRRVNLQSATEALAQFQAPLTGGGILTQVLSRQRPDPGAPGGSHCEPPARETFGLPHRRSGQARKSNRKTRRK